MAPKLRILLIGDYSNCHATLATALRDMGHEVLTAAEYNYLSARRPDIVLRRKRGKIGGIAFYLKAINLITTRMKDFDVVAFAYPQFMPLHPQRLRKLLGMIKVRNRALFYTAMNTDTGYISMFELPDSPVKYNEWFINGQATEWHNENRGLWEELHDKTLVDYQKHFFSAMNGAVSVLYEYHKGLEMNFSHSKIAYVGIPIDTSKFNFEPPVFQGKIRILLGRISTRIKMKGTHLLETAAKKVAEMHCDTVEFKLVGDMPYHDFIEEIKKAHIILDQVYSYTPATTALIALAMGKTVVSGAENDFYEFIEEDDNCPIINAPLQVEDLTRAIEKILDKRFLIDNSYASRNFVEKHNDYKTVARRCVDFWSLHL